MRKKAEKKLSLKTETVAKLNTIAGGAGKPQMQNLPGTSNLGVTCMCGTNGSGKDPEPPAPAKQQQQLAKKKAGGELLQSGNSPRGYLTFNKPIVRAALLVSYLRLGNQHPRASRSHDSFGGSLAALEVRAELARNILGMRGARGRPSARAQQTDRAEPRHAAPGIGDHPDFGGGRRARA
jgi:hypothetical protein